MLESFSASNSCTYSSPPRAYTARVEYAAQTSSSEPRVKPDSPEAETDRESDLRPDVILPPPCSKEGEHTSIPLDPKFSTADLETALESCEDRIEIHDNMMWRTMGGEALSKARVFGPFSTAISPFCYAQGIRMGGATSGIRFSNGTLLVPDQVAHRADRCRGDQHALAHMMAPSFVPNWVLEVIWHHEYDEIMTKVRGKYFHPDFHGLEGSMIEEVWVLSMPQPLVARPIPVTPGPSPAVVGPVPLESIRLEVFFRVDSPGPSAVYDLSTHQSFVAPVGSIFADAGPVDLSHMYFMLEL